MTWKSSFGRSIFELATEEVATVLLLALALFGAKNEKYNAAPPTTSINSATPRAIAGHVFDFQNQIHVLHIDDIDF